MRRRDLLSEYKEVLEGTGIVPSDLIDIYAAELVRRHRRGWTLPVTTYRRCKDILYYKDSLERNSPYYTDLLKIKDKESLTIVMRDICHTIRVKPF